jgi:ribonuclease HIII
MAVAAASILARDVFVRRLEALGEQVGVALHKGAGAPVLASGREYLRLHGAAQLGAVAKLHFATTAKLLGSS